MKEESLIHMRVPAAVKGRWVSASRAEGMRLTDFLVAVVEAHLQQQKGGDLPVGVDSASEVVARKGGADRR